MADELRLGMGKRLPWVEHSLRTESEQANQRVQPKREGDLRKAEQRTGPRRIGDRRNNWRGQIEHEQWKDKGRRRLENERRLASKELRQTERRGEQGDRRKEAPERRALFNPRHHRSTDCDYRIHNNEDRSVRPEGDGRVGASIRLDDSFGKQGPPGSTTYSPQVPLNIPRTPSEAAPSSSNFIQSFIQAGERLWERLFGSSH
jgi:hypothetical protein